MTDFNRQLAYALFVQAALSAVIAIGAASSVHARELCEASQYGVNDGYNGGKVACAGMGPFNTHATSPYTVAHPNKRMHPCGSYVTVTNLANGKSIRAMVTDAGPYVAGRCVDLGRAGADAIGMGGTAGVSVD